MTARSGDHWHNAPPVQHDRASRAEVLVGLTIGGSGVEAEDVTVVYVCTGRRRWSAGDLQ